MADTIQLADAKGMLRQCRASLDNAGHGLSSAVKAREQDFLDLGEALYSLQGSCEEIAQNAQELVSCTSAQDMHDRLHALSAELEGLTNQAAQAAGRQSLDEIDAVVVIVDELSTILSAFSKIVKHLSMLGIATRIESARLGADGRGFTTLADDVEKLANQIVSHCAGIAGRIETLRGHVGSARQRNMAILGTQEQCHDVIVRELGANIKALAEMASCSVDISQDLSRSAAGIAADIGQAVRSMQFHDIVRQQVEHAEQAIGETSAMLAAEVDRAADSPVLEELAAFTADVLTLQSSQIQSADNHFIRAADTLRDSLGAIAGRIRSMGDTIAGLAGGEGDDTPLSRLEAGVATVKAELGDFAAEGEALGNNMDAVAETVSGMSGAIEAIEEVGAEIELIAINASIKAAHTGTAGAALGVLALAIQRLSADARRQTDAVARILGNIASASKGLQENASRYNDQSEAWRVVGELDAVLAETTQSAARCQELFTLLRNSSRNWGGRADDLSRRIVFDREIGRALSEVRRVLDGQIAAAKTIAPGGGKGRSARLRQLFDRYTMEAERDVHEAAFGASHKAKAKALPGRAAVAAASATAGDSDFGDNVELF